MSKRLHAVINPASGQDQPILNTLNNVLHPAGIDWDISLTKKSGDAQRFARQAAEGGADVVAVYGGDGTVMEAASGLMGLETPLAVFPGGTANVFSVTVGIPKPLKQAIELALRALQGEAGYKIKPVDLAQLNGNELFILRLGAGFEAEQDARATRELKDKAGRLAYSMAGLQTLKKLPMARYRLTLDGEVHEAEGISLMVANTTNTGVPGVYLSPGNDVGDGLLDVVVFEPTRSESVFTILSFNLFRSPEEVKADFEKIRLREYWQAKEILVDADPPQRMVIDGEDAGFTPCRVSVLPHAVNVIVPG